MGRKVYSPILQTAKWGRSQKGKKKKLCEVGKGVFPSFFADRITCNWLCIPSSHWAPGKWHVHVGSCFISVSYWALCHHTVTFTYFSWSLLSLHHYLSWQSHRSRMDTKTPDSAGLIWFGEDRHNCRRDLEFKDGRWALPGTQPPKLSCERQGEWPPVECVHCLLDPRWFDTLNWKELQFAKDKTVGKPGSPYLS